MSKQPKNPLLTFAILAYNQEEFINDAIDGAFSQSYQPLEIILSDDCSRDRTFDIIRKRANEYSGPHRIIFRKNKENTGLVNHIAAILEESSSDYIIVAAGDDISKPDRAEKISEKINPPIFDIICSNIDIVNEDGKTLEESTYLSVDYMKKYIKSFDDNFLVAPAAAYKKSFLKAALDSIKTSRLNYKLQNEDFLFWLFLVGTDGRITRISDCSLVKYRLNQKSISSVSTTAENLRAEKEWLLKERSMARVNYSKQVAAVEMISSPLFRVDRVNKSAIEKSLKSSYINSLSLSDSFFERAFGLSKARSRSSFRVSALRLFGVNFAAFIRYFLSKN